jgi:membrane protein CcdC involved in cytochrome C biogenesis
MNTKTTAKDFFTWFAAMIGLYVSVGALVTLWFSLIDIGTGSAVLSYDTGMRTAVASLVVAFPLYVWFTRMIHQNERADASRKDIWVRRWALYATLFISGLIIAIDVIVLITTFLNGEELTIGFLLKVASLIVILVATFWYYIQEIRDAWSKKQQQSELIAMIVGAVVVASVILMFVMGGSPSYLRHLREDEAAVNDLTSIQYQVTDYWQKKGVLPKTLTELNDPLSSFTVPTQQGVAYEYTATGPLTFELCASFKETSPVAVPETQPQYHQDDTYWRHGVGRTCFGRTIDTALHPRIKN